MRYDSIIFDLDGTLWNVPDVFLKVWNQVLINSHGKPDFNQIKDYIGIETYEVLDQVLPDSGFSEKNEIIELIEAIQSRFLDLDGRHNLVFGLKDGLPRLASFYRIFIVSNCSISNLRSFYKASGAEHYVTGSLCYGENQKKKSVNLKLIQEQFGLSNPVYVGDEFLDLEECKKVGMDFIQVTYGIDPRIPGVKSYDNFYHLVKDLLLMAINNHEINPN